MTPRPEFHISLYLVYTIIRFKKPLKFWVQISLKWGVQHYVIKFVSDFFWFSPSPLVSSTNKTDCHHNNWNIVESGIKHHLTSTTNHRTSLPCPKCLIGDYIAFVLTESNTSLYPSVLKKNWLRTERHRRKWERALVGGGYLKILKF